MSAYKTVNKRADPKRNFRSVSCLQRLHERSKERRVRKIEAGFERSRGNRIMHEKERYERRVGRIGKWRKREEPKRENKSRPPPERAEGGGEREGTMEEKGGNGRETREKEKNMGE